MTENKTKVLHFRHSVKNIIFISAGILSATYGLRGFLLPNGFIDGGVTGMSLLVNQVTGFSFSLLIFLINLPFILLGYRHEGKTFALKTFIAVSVLALAVHFLHFPVATDDKLLVSVFGGFFLGMGIGLAMRGGCVIDGTEVLALFTSKKAGVTIGDVILTINILIFSFAAFLLSYETALYSILTYLAASKTIDFVVQGIEEYTGVTIISEKSEEIRQHIIHTTGRGVTIYNGKRGFGNHGDKNLEMDIVFTVVTKLEITKLKNKIEQIDDKAFILMHSINEARGGMIKKRPLHN